MKKIFRQNRQLILYGLIGGTGALIDLALYILFYKYTGIPPFIASFLSVSFGILNNFFLNLKFNFKKKNHILKRLLSFYLVGLGGAILSVVLIFIFHNILTIEPTLSKILTILPVVLLQFFVNKHVSFSDNPTKTLKALVAKVKPYILSSLLIFGCLIVFTSAAVLQPGHDEMDNILGGKLITEGKLPYVDFFSHHSPGMYFLTALFYPLIQNDLFAHRVAYSILTFTILLITYLLIRRRIDKISANIYIVLASFAHAATLSYMVLAESLIAHLFIAAFILLFFKKTNVPTLKDCAYLSVILFCIPLLSLGYVFPVLLLYSFAAYQVLSYVYKTSAWKYLLKVIAIVFTPYLLLACYLTFTGSIKDAYQNVFIFNSQYYPKFSDEVGGGIFNTLFAGVLGSIKQIYTVLINFPDSSHILQLALLFGIASLVYYFWTKKKKVEAFLLLPLLLVLNTRVNRWNPPAIETQLANINQHGSLYIGFAIFASSIGFTYFLTHKSSSRLISSLTLPVLIFAAIIPFYIVTTWAIELKNVMTTETQKNFYTYSTKIKEDNLATPINRILTPQESAWIGAANFSSQLYLKEEHPFYFIFYSDAVASYQPFTQRHLADLNQVDPEIIHFYPIDNCSKYHREICRYLADKYYTVNDPSLQNYYFLNDKKDELDKKIRKAGYDEN